MDEATPLRVLVVEDCPDNHESMCVLLGIWGHRVRDAGDGTAALALAPGFRPDVALLDIGLPGLDGYEVARRLRRVPGLEGAVLVALTAYGQAQDVARAEEAGFDRHMLKPCDFDALRELLDRVAGERSGDALAAHEEPAPA
jgi:CheY-like chemotaxis protein